MVTIKKLKKRHSGFTLMEIIVATALFAFTSVALTSLFNYVLKINRRAESLRQATQSMRDFVELVTKEVRNGQVDYGVINGSTVQSQVGPCPIPPLADPDNTRTPAFNGTITPGLSLTSPDQLQNVASSYLDSDNRLGVIDANGDRWCFFLGDNSGNYVGLPSGINDAAHHQGQTLMVQKSTTGAQQLVNSSNTVINYLAFAIRPECDPYITTCDDYGDKAPKVQPFVAIAINFTVTLPTGEKTVIYYQTSVSTDKYDVPNSP